MNLLKKLAPIALVWFVLNCAAKAEITWDTEVYSDPELKNKIGEIKKGTAVTAYDYRNHNTSWYPRKYVKIKGPNGEGYVSSKKLVTKQDPENSVFKWGYRKDYKYFYAPNDKRYPKGYEFSSLSALPKDKIPLEELLKDTQLDK